MSSNLIVTALRCDLFGVFWIMSVLDSSSLLSLSSFFWENNCVNTGRVLGEIKYLKADLFKCLFNVGSNFGAAAVGLVLVSVAAFAHDSTRNVDQGLDDLRVLG